MSNAQFRDKVESVYEAELQKVGMTGMGKSQGGKGFFKALKRGLAKVGSTVLESLDIPRDASFSQAFIAGMKSPWTLSKKFEDKTGFKLAKAAKSIGEGMLVVGAAGNPELLPIGGALIAGGELAGQVGLGQKGSGMDCCQSGSGAQNKDVDKQLLNPSAYGTAVGPIPTTLTITRLIHNPQVY